LLACLAIVFIHFGAGALTLLHKQAIRIGQNMVNDLRGALYAHLQRSSLAFHGRWAISCIGSPRTVSRSRIMNGALPILSALVLLAGMLVVLFPLDPVLTVRALTVVPMISQFNHRIIDVATEARTTESRVSSLVQWWISAIKLVPAFTKEEEYRSFMGASQESLRATLRLYSWQTLYSGTVNPRNRAAVPR
jgi:ATP-binding cassette, subfamily B, bacterial